MFHLTVSICGIVASRKMTDFLFQKVMPGLLVFFGVASIDTPGNFARKVFLELCDQLQFALSRLPIDIF